MGDVGDYTRMTETLQGLGYRGADHLNSSQEHRRVSFAPRPCQYLAFAFVLTLPNIIHL